MENASLVGLSRQVVLRRELDVIANNVANMNTTGFKAEQMVFSEFMMPNARDGTFPTQDQKLSFVQQRGTWHSFAPGNVEATGGAMDFAIDGEGFFVVETEAGERYTRSGEFGVNASGQLVTANGAPLLSTAGPIQLAPNETGLTIGRDGTIATSEGVRGRLRLVSFDDPRAIHKIGSNLYATTEDPKDAPATTAVVQGAVEKSNVKPIVEMSRLIEVNRAYTSISGILDAQNDIRRSAIEKLAEVPA
ncbi:flagellar basal-body rod protein FlgF [Methylopila capsulata]|uniref:Flagellar basal-body rod protein FlgF n=1 Tax=Methylopila capsulata TaxID=61654 RepID=A0A9W6IRY1_9HYPH|nr:flagellar basal-body rod protein FlgF [Methylopila capsulata]MBM7851062.1 flagellar basal-body rod protein FlgF [Methylopila capsulata]GLK54120.1 flagellar basal-body rod protein FlgF [Methylopila capsulata]